MISQYYLLLYKFEHYQLKNLYLYRSNGLHFLFIEKILAWMKLFFLYNNYLFSCGEIWYL